MLSVKPLGAASNWTVGRTATLTGPFMVRTRIRPERPSATGSAGQEPLR
jgi:hypothetical protein